MSHHAAFETARPTHDELPPAPGAEPRLLGQYLVDIGAIDLDDVREALELMRLCNSPLGEIAVGEGVLSSRQLNTLLREQRAIDGQFSELAVALGMGEHVGDRLEDLSAEQDTDNLRFGDALVELGVLTSTALDTHLDRYEREELGGLASLPEGVRGASLEEALDLFPRIARRSMQTAVRLGSARAWDGHAWDAHATASFAGPHGLALGLSVEVEVAATLGSHFDADKIAWYRKLAPVLLADFIGMNAQMVRSKLDPAGLEHGDVQLRPGEMPVRGLCFDLAFETGRGVLVLDAGA